MNNAQKLKQRPLRKSARRVWVVTNWGSSVHSIGTTRKEAMREAMDNVIDKGRGFPDYYEVRKMTLVDGWHK